MKQKKVYLTVGLPGSGKSTWVQKQIKKNGGLYISRDIIRFSFLKENDDYFSKEELVFKHFLKLIQEGLNSDEIDKIYIDATHLTEKSRCLVLDKLNLKNVSNIILLYFKINIKDVIKRNSYRKGRERVPEKVIYSMNKKFYKPKATKKYSYTIWTINENGEVINIE